MIKRKIQYGKDGKWIHNYYFTNRNNLAVVIQIVIT